MAGSGGPCETRRALATEVTSAAVVHRRPLGDPQARLSGEFCSGAAADLLVESTWGVDHTCFQISDLCRQRIQDVFHLGRGPRRCRVVQGLSAAGWVAVHGGYADWVPGRAGSSSGGSAVKERTRQAGAGVRDHQPESARVAGDQ